MGYVNCPNRKESIEYYNYAFQFATKYFPNKSHSERAQMAIKELKDYKFLRQMVNLTIYDRLCGREYTIWQIGRIVFAYWFFHSPI